MSDFYSLKDFADGPHMVVDPKGKWAWAADLAAAHAEIERLTKERDYYAGLYQDGCNTYSEMHVAIEKTEAELAQATATVELVNSNNLTLAAELTGWKQAARQMEAERDEALAQVAMAYEESANEAKSCCHEGDYVANAIRALTPTDAKSALEAYGRKKVREGMRRAADVAIAVVDRDRESPRNLSYLVERAILAAMEKESGE